MSEASSLKATPCSSVDVPEWDALNLVTQNANFSGPPPLPAFDISLLESQGAHCSTADLIEQIPRLACLNSGSFLEAINSFALSEEGCIRNPRVPPDFSSKIDQGMEKDLSGRKRKTVLDDDGFDSHSSFNRIQNFQSEQQKNVLPGTVKSSVEKDEKRQIVGSNTRKSNLKHAKENPQNGDSSKEDYIHIRAKRGQATNSHSLAERVRREKISERMRFLQNLVPGCSKITGKAVMLDEIINYVQSLQRQVEFLSMKLATVNPELNFDIEQLLSKDILQLRAGNSASLMFDPGMSNSSPHLHGYTPQALMQSEMSIQNTPISQAMLRSTLSNISHMPQTSSLWDDEFQNVFQMGFMPNMHVSGTEQPGSMKLE